MRTAILLFAVAVVVACSTPPRSYWRLAGDEGTLRVGISAADMEDRIGAPDDVEPAGETGEVWSYLYTDPSTPTLQATLTVTLEDGRVTRWETTQGE